MDASKRLLNLFFIAGALLAWMVFAKLFGTVFQTFGVRDVAILGRTFTLSTVLGVAAAIALAFWVWQSRGRIFVQEATEELVRVTWPTWKETQRNTKVTVILSVVFAFILWVFDQIFGSLTRLILGG